MSQESRCFVLCFFYEKIFLWLLNSVGVAKLFLITYVNRRSFSKECCVILSIIVEVSRLNYRFGTLGASFSILQKTARVDVSELGNSNRHRRSFACCPLIQLFVYRWINDPSPITAHHNTSWHAAYNAKNGVRIRPRPFAKTPLCPLAKGQWVVLKVTRSMRRRGRAVIIFALPLWLCKSMRRTSCVCSGRGWRDTDLAVAARLTWCLVTCTGGVGVGGVG